jgi:hypothetical protein
MMRAVRRMLAGRVGPLFAWQALKLQVATKHREFDR